MVPKHCHIAQSKTLGLSPLSYPYCRSLTIHSSLWEWNIESPFSGGLLTACTLFPELTLFACLGNLARAPQSSKSGIFEQNSEFSYTKSAFELCLHSLGSPILNFSCTPLCECSKAPNTYFTYLKLEQDHADPLAQRTREKSVPE